MRILNKKEFLELPRGVFFSPASGKGYTNFDNVYVKAETCRAHNDNYWYLYFDSIEFSSTEEMHIREAEMIEKGASYPMNEGIERDDCYVEDQLFLVFEKDDLEILRENIDYAIKISQKLDM